MKWLVLPALWLMYWGICFICTGTDKKNLAGLRSYPDEVQAAVRERLGNEAPKDKPIPSILLGNLLLFTAVFSILGIVLKGLLSLDGYFSAFWYFLLLGEGLGLFDLVVIDLLWWRNTQRIRFSFLPNKAAYQDPGRHHQEMSPVKTFAYRNLGRHLMNRNVAKVRVFSNRLLTIY